MDVIQDSNADGVAMPLVASLKPEALWEAQQGMREGAILEEDEEGEEGEEGEEAEGERDVMQRNAVHAIHGSGSSAGAATWQQSMAASAAESAAGSSDASMQANGAGHRAARRSSSQTKRQRRAGSAGLAAPLGSPEEVAAELESLLGVLTGEEASLPAAAESTPEQQGNGHANGAVAPQPQPAGQQHPSGSQEPAAAQAHGAGYRHAGFPAPQPQPGSLEQHASATPFAAAAGIPLGSGGLRSRPGSLNQPRLSVRSSQGPGSLPISPFESCPPGSLPPMDSLSPSAHNSSLHPPCADHERSPSIATLGRASLTPPLDAHFPAGTRLESTGEVWHALRSKALSSKTPGVRFVSFPAGADMDIPEKAVGTCCLLIKNGAQSSGGGGGGGGACV
jgi:hypothetical protein